MGSRVASPGYSTDLESPAQGLSGKFVLSHNGQLEAPFWGGCPFLGGLGNSLGDLIKRPAPPGLACSVSIVRCHSVLEVGVSVCIACAFVPRPGHWHLAVSIRDP